MRVGRRDAREGGSIRAYETLRVVEPTPRIRHRPRYIFAHIEAAGFMIAVAEGAEPS
jgi:hypothetical protein